MGNDKGRTTQVVSAFYFALCHLRCGEDLGPRQSPECLTTEALLFGALTAIVNWAKSWYNL